MTNRKTIVANTAVIIVCAELLLILLSWYLAATQTEGVRSLLSSEGIRWFFGQYTAVLLRSELIWLLLASMAGGTLWRSDIMGRGDQNLRRTYALRISLVVFVILLIVVMLLVLVPHAVLLSSTGQLWPSPFSRASVPLLALLIIVTSIFYGIVSRTFTSLVSIISSLTWGIEKASSLILLYIFAFHFYESLRYVFF